MKLVLARDQNKTIFGTARFILKTAAELTPQESENIRKYNMGRLILYSDLKAQEPGFWSFIVSVFRKIRRLITRSTKGLVISINDLVIGRQIECKDILEIVSIEGHMKEACETFKIVLEMAANFGGVEVIEF